MKRFGSEEGGSLVEMAIASSLLFMTLFGIIEFSFAFYSYNFAAEAAKEGARYASVRGVNSCTLTPHLSDCGITAAQLQTVVQNMGFPGINATNVTVNPAMWPDTCLDTGVSNCKEPGSNVKVVVNYSFPLSVPFWNATHLHLQSTAEMVISN
jgi:Flp pilus assembly protein TadG